MSHDQANRLRLCQAGLQQASPRASIRQYREHLSQLIRVQNSIVRQQLLKAGHRVDLSLRSLDALNPAKTLARGYAAVSKDAQLVTSVKQLKTGDDIEIELADGKTDARIK